MTSLEVRDEYPVRVRSAFDGMRVSGGVLLILVLAAIGVWVEQASDGLNTDLVRIVDRLPTLIIASLQVIGGASAFAGYVLVVALLVMRNRFRQLTEGLLVGAAAVGLGLLANYLLDLDPGSAIHQALTLGPPGSSTEAIDTYLAAWTALLFATSVTLQTVTRGLTVAAFTLYVVASLGSANASALSLAMSAVFGATVALAARYLLGTINERPRAVDIAAVLSGRGLDISRIDRVPSSAAHRVYRATTSDGRALHVDVLDRDSVSSGWFYRAYRIIRLQGEVTAGPALSIDRATERRILLGLSAQAAGAHVQHLVGGYACGPRAMVVAYDHIDATPLTELGREPSDAEIKDLWRNGELLHRQGVSHPRLTPSRIRVDATGAVLLPILTDGRAVAGDVRMDLDRAQVLITSALLVGPRRAVTIAQTTLTEHDLAAVMAVMQPVALTREIRKSLAEHKTLLDDLRAAWRSNLQAADQPDPADQEEMPQLERVRPRTVIALVGLLIAAWLLIAQLGSLDLVTLLRTAKWQWVPLLLAASAVTYVAAAVSIMGYVRERLSLLRTTLVQLASSFAGFVLPPAIGPLAINIRYLQRCGLSTAAAATAVGTSQIINGASHALLLAGAAAATGSEASHAPTVPPWAYFALGALVALMVVALSIPQLRRPILARIMPMLVDVGPRLLDLISRPVKLAEAVGGALLLNGGYIAALWFAMRAFNGHVAILTVAVIYLAGAAVGSIAPTPGGIGAIEVALSTGLATAHMPGAAAVSAVLLYRLGTFWLPVPVGWGAMHQLQRTHLL